MQSPIQGKHSTHLSHNCYKCNKTCNVQHFSRFTFEIKGRTIYLPRQPTAGSSFKVHFICAWIFTALSPHLHTGHLQLPKWAWWPAEWSPDSQHYPPAADPCPKWRASPNLIGIFHLLPCSRVFLYYFFQIGPIRIKRRSSPCSVGDVTNTQKTWC